MEIRNSHRSCRRVLLPGRCRRHTEYTALLWILAPGGDICERVAQNAHRSELGGPATCVVLPGQVSGQPVGCSAGRDV